MSGVCPLGVRQPRQPCPGGGRRDSTPGQSPAPHDLGSRASSGREGEVQRERELCQQSHRWGLPIPSVAPHRQPTNWRHKMATLALDPPGEGTEGLPLQLTTITVAVPQPLSPGTVSVLQGGDCGAAQGFKWKYEQPKPEKQGSTLVSWIWCRGAIGREVE